MRTMIFRIIAIIFLFLFLFSCKIEQSAENVIKMNDAIIKELYMSDYFESIEYIPLETQNNCLIGINPVFYITTEFIVAINPKEKDCFLFDRFTGKYIRKIGQVGQGPEDYFDIPLGIVVNEQEKKISFGQGDHLIEYSLTDGSAIPVSTNIPRIATNKLTYVTKDIWAIGLFNPIGNNHNQILFFNRKEKIDSIPNQYLFTLKVNNIIMDPDECFFYCYNNSVYYKNIYNDTIFKIIDRKLQPEWVFDMQKSTHLLFQSREDPLEYIKELEKFKLLKKILETDEYLFFEILYQKQKHFFFYHKNQCKLTELEQGKFINDIDGGLAFWPTYTNQNQYLICIYQAFDMKDEVENSKLREQNIKNMPAFMKMRSLVSQLDEEDNPIVVIVKLKNTKTK